MKNIFIFIILMLFLYFLYYYNKIIENFYNSCKHFRGDSRYLNGKDCSYLPYTIVNYDRCCEDKAHTNRSENCKTAQTIIYPCSKDNKYTGNISIECKSIPNKKQKDNSLVQTPVPKPIEPAIPDYEIIELENPGPNSYYSVCPSLYKGKSTLSLNKEECLNYKDTRPSTELTLNPAPFEETTATFPKGCYVMTNSHGKQVFFNNHAHGGPGDGSALQLSVDQRSVCKVQTAGGLQVQIQPQQTTTITPVSSRTTDIGIFLGVHHKDGKTNFYNYVPKNLYNINILYFKMIVPARNVDVYSVRGNDPVITISPNIIIHSCDGNEVSLEHKVQIGNFIEVIIESISDIDDKVVSGHSNKASIYIKESGLSNTGLSGYYHGVDNQNQVKILENVIELKLYQGKNYDNVRLDREVIDSAHNYRENIMEEHGFKVGERFTNFRKLNFDSKNNNCSYLPYSIVNYDKCCCNIPGASEKTCKNAKLIIDECPGRITATCTKHSKEHNSCHDINYVNKNKDNYNECCRELNRDSRMEEICNKSL